MSGPKLCIDCKEIDGKETEVPETDLYCHSCRDVRVLNGRDGINPKSPPILPHEVEGFRVPSTGEYIVDEAGRSVDVLELAVRYRNETRPRAIALGEYV